MIDKLIEDGTGETCQFWMDFIGNMIQKHTKPSDNPLHGFTESDQWLIELSQELWKRVQPRHDLTKMDENIICSSLMGLILVQWSCRVRRAKSYDPRRPVEIRKGMMKRFLDYQHALMDAMMNEENDHNFFPKQEWDPPFVPGAKNGDFV